MPPAGADAAFLTWAGHKDLLAIEAELDISRIYRQMATPLTAVAKVVLSYLQVSASFLYTFPEPAVLWPDPFVQVCRRFAYFNVERCFSVDIVHFFQRFLDFEKLATGKEYLDFVADLDYGNLTFAFLLSTSAFLVTVPAAAYLITAFKWRRYLREALVDRAIAIMLAFCYLVYPGVNVRLLNLFRSRELGGTVLYVDPRIAYDEILWLRVAAIGFFLLFTIGIPVVFSWRLLKAKRRAETPPLTFTPAAREERAYELQRDRFKYGLLDANYAPRCWWWEAYELVRKVFIVALLLMILPGTAMQMWIAILACLTALVTTSFVNPFVSGKVNALNFISMACLLMIGTLGLAHHKDYATGAHTTPNATPLTLFERLLPSVYVALLFAPIVASLLVIGLLYLDAREHRMEALQEYDQLPASVRDEVPDAIRKADRDRIVQEFRKRHANAMVHAVAHKAAEHKAALAAKQKDYIERQKLDQEEILHEEPEARTSRMSRKKSFMPESMPDFMPNRDAPPDSPSLSTTTTTLPPPPSEEEGDVPEEYRESRLDAKGTLRVTLATATGLIPTDADANVASWYAVVRVDAKEERSHVLDNIISGRSGTWDETLEFGGFTLREAISAGAQLVLVDVEMYRWDKDSLPKVEIDLRPLQSSTSMAYTKPLARGRLEADVKLTVSWVEASLEA